MPTRKTMSRCFGLWRKKSHPHMCWLFIRRKTSDTMADFIPSGCQDRKDLRCGRAVPDFKQLQNGEGRKLNGSRLQEAGARRTGNKKQAACQVRKGADAGKLDCCLRIIESGSSHLA